MFIGKQKKVIFIGKILTSLPIKKVYQILFPYKFQKLWCIDTFCTCLLKFLIIYRILFY